MAAAHRVHIAAMSTTMYEKLGEIPDIELSWSLTRETIGQWLLGRAFTTVPYFSLADYFNQLFIFTKKRKVLDILMRRPPTYKMIGNLDYMMDRNQSTWYPQFDFSPWDVADGSSMHNDYRFMLTSSSNTLVPKLIEVVIKQARVRAVPIPTNESIVFQMGFCEELRTSRVIYIISEVVMASYVHFMVRIGAQRRFANYDRDVPIAFRYKKYVLKPNGFLGRELETDLKFNDRDSTWLRPGEDTVLMLPVFAKAKVQRKNRTALTVVAQSPAEPRFREMNQNPPAVVPVNNVAVVNQAQNNAQNMRIMYVYRPNQNQDHLAEAYRRARSIQDRNLGQQERDDDPQRH